MNSPQFFLASFYNYYFTSARKLRDEKKVGKVNAFFILSRTTTLRFFLLPSSFYISYFLFLFLCLHESPSLEISKCTSQLNSFNLFLLRKKMSWLFVRLVVSLYVHKNCSLVVTTQLGLCFFFMMMMTMKYWRSLIMTSRIEETCRCFATLLFTVKIMSLKLLGSGGKLLIKICCARSFIQWFIHAWLFH